MGGDGRSSRTGGTAGRADRRAGRDPADSRDAPVLPDRSDDDTDRGWGERDVDAENDRRLVEDRPPHWE